MPAGRRCSTRCGSRWPASLTATRRALTPRAGPRAPLSMPPATAPPARVARASFAGHRLGPGRGGVLSARRAAPLPPLRFGGPQEGGRRAGREDLAGAVAVAAALAACADRGEAWSAAAAAPAARL